MGNKYPVTVILTTYDKGDGARTSIARQTIQGLVDNLHYSNLHWIISDNNSPKHEEHVSFIVEPLKEKNIPFEVLNVKGGGVGLSKNVALTRAYEISSLIFMTEDDWYLSEPFELESDVQVMLDNPSVCMVRYGFLGGEMLAKYTDFGDFKTYWTLVPNSGLYVYSGQVSLRSKLLTDMVGWHSPNLEPGQEELDMCHKYNSLGDSAPKILWPARHGSILNASPFKNLGLGNSLNNMQVIL